MKGNLFDLIPSELPEEVFQTLVQSGTLKVERIISRGHATPEGQWYDQAHNEWVVLLSGGARLTIEGKEGFVEMKPGDYVMLPAGLRHRVDWTDPEQDSVWLAINFQLTVL